MNIIILTTSFALSVFGLLALARHIEHKRNAGYVFILLGCAIAVSSVVTNFALGVSFADMIFLTNSHTPFFPFKIGLGLGFFAGGLWLLK